MSGRALIGSTSRPIVSTSRLGHGRSSRSPAQAAVAIGGCGIGIGVGSGIGGCGSGAGPGTGGGGTGVFQLGKVMDRRYPDVLDDEHESRTGDNDEPVLSRTRGESWWSVGGTRDDFSRW